MIEYVDHLHEHFVTPVDRRTPVATAPPIAPGSGAEMHAASIDEYTWGARA